MNALKSSSTSSVSRPKTKVKKKRELQASTSPSSVVEALLENEDETESPPSPSEEVSTLVLEPAEVLVIGTNSIAERLASHFISKLHRGTYRYFPS